jgi:leader peptidase (prepilin peptidase)/N-methyltransferase
LSDLGVGGLPDVVLELLAALVGACLGSFLNVCVLRWPQDRSVVRPRSRCPSCGHGLAWFENIPVASWLALRGRCRCCGERISVQYPLVELVVGTGWWVAFDTFGPGFTAVRVAVFGTILLGIALTDLREYVIPDGFTLGGLVWVLGTMTVAFVRGDTSPFAGPYEAVIGACTGAGMIAIVGWLGEIATRREAMGLGDVTLMAFAGAALGPTRAIVTIFLGATLGAVVFLLVVIPVMRMRRVGGGHEQTELALGATTAELPLVPFGVFLAPAAMAALLWGHSLVDWIAPRP